MTFDWSPPCQFDHSTKWNMLAVLEQLQEWWLHLPATPPPPCFLDEQPELSMTFKGIFFLPFLNTVPSRYMILFKAHNAAEAVESSRVYQGGFLKVVLSG